MHNVYYIKNFVSVWKKNIDDNHKMTLYNHVQFDYCVDNYVLYINNKRNRSLLTRLRAGCLDIEIEVGRWRGVPHNQRICRICNDDIETEMHF